MSTEPTLAGRTALVTGAGQGVGRAIALSLGASGAHVLVNDLVLDRARGVVAEIVEAGGQASSAVFDVTSYQAVAEELGDTAVDVLVNNAGNAGHLGAPTIAHFADSDPSTWASLIDVNLYGVLNCTRAVVGGMVERRWGRVVTIISDAARVGEPGLAVYGAAKAGAAGFSRALAAEVGRHGVTVNCIALGTIRTPPTEEFWRSGDPERHRRILRKYAVQRPGDPEEIAAVASLLCSPAASWITGQTYPVNGGSSPSW